MSVDSDISYWQRKLADAKREVADSEQHLLTLQQQKQKQLIAEAQQAAKAAELAKQEADQAAKTSSSSLADTLF